MPPFVKITECEFESNNHSLAISRDAASVELMVKVAGTMTQDVQQFNLFSERMIHVNLRWQDGLPYFLNLRDRPRANLVLLEEIAHDDGTAFGGVSYDLDIDPDKFDRILTTAIERFLIKPENGPQPLTERMPSCEICEIEEPKQNAAQPLVTLQIRALTAEESIVPVGDEPWPFEAGRCQCLVTGRGNLIHADGMNKRAVSFRADIDFDYEPQGDRLVFSRTPIGLFAESVFAVDSDTNRWVNIVVPGSDDEDIRTWLRAGLDDYFEDRWGKNLRLLMPQLRIQSRNGD